MKKNLQVFYGVIILLVFGLFGTSEVQGQDDPVLRHSYTFEDETANDVVGDAHGTLEGGAISDGVYVSSADGDHIVLPGETIALNTYSAITIEAYVTAGSGTNPGFTMLSYFGGSTTNFGTNGYFMSIARGDDVSRTAISTGSETEPWSVEDGVNGPELEDGAIHHLVSILTNDSIVFYIDGRRQGRADIRDGRSISDLSNEYAMLARGGYLNDPTWKGSIHEFNIYEGVMSAEQIAANSREFIGIAGPGLSGINVFIPAEGEEEEDEVFSLEPGFNTNNLSYTVKVPIGTESVTVEATPTDEASTVDGSGEYTLEDGRVTVSIVVTNEEEESETYTILIREFVDDPNLSGITLGEGELDQEFDPEVLEYNVNVPAGTESVTITGIPNHSGAIVRGGGAVDVTGGSGTATLVVESEAGTEKTYTVLLLVEGMADNATIQALEFLQEGQLSPAFDPEVTQYSYVLSERGRNHMHIIPRPTVANATVQVGNDGIVDLEDGTGTAVIVVTALDRETTKTYTINVTQGEVTSVGSEINSALKVYPTVSANDFTVDFGSEGGKVFVYDLSGKVIAEKVTSDSKTSVSISKAGMYIFHLQCKGLSKNVKVFKID